MEKYMLICRGRYGNGGIFNTLEEARNAYLHEVRHFLAAQDLTEDDLEILDMADLDESMGCEYAKDDFQQFKIIAVPEFRSRADELVWDIKHMCEMGDDAITEYSYFLEDSGDARHGYDQIPALVDELMELMQKREFVVKTPAGDLRAYAKHETDTPEDFPGIYVDLVGEGEDEMLACVEYDSGDKLIQACVYRRGQDEPVSIWKDMEGGEAR